jgi:hypothetical protein
MDLYMIFANFYRDYFSLNLKDYSNINIDLEINKIIFFIFIGIMIATVVLNYRRYCMIVLIKRLLRYDATDITNAKSISELGIKKHHAKCAMSTGRMSKIVYSTERREYTYDQYSQMIKQGKGREEKIDFLNERLYIKETEFDNAHLIADNNHPTVFNTFLFCVFILASCVCIMFIMPSILNFINIFLAK